MNDSETKLVTFNIMGTKYQLTMKKFKQLPVKTRLGKLKELIPFEYEKVLKYCDEFNKDTNELFFNRDPDCFKFVLNYLLTGELHMKRNICTVHVKNELDYWMVDPKEIKRCCKTNYELEYDQEIENIKIEEDAIEFVKENEEFVPNRRERLWAVLDDPKSSNLALVFMIVELLVLYLLDCIKI